MANKRKPILDTRKATFIDVMKRNFGNISKACDVVGISRQAYYKWIKEDLEFKERVDSIGEYLLDMAENALYTKIKKGHLTATIFYLKTKGKERGYVERVEQKDLTPPVFKMIDARGMSRDQIEGLIDNEDEGEY